MTRNPVASRLRPVTLALIVPLAAMVAAHAAGPGERIYREGILPSGQPVQAERGPSMHITAATAACVNCHRRSGLGMQEGRTTIPPVAGIYLFHPRARVASV